MKKLNSQLYAVTEDELKNIDPHDNNNLYVTDAIVENGKLKSAGKIANGDKETIAEDLPELESRCKLSIDSGDSLTDEAILVGTYWYFNAPLGEYKVSVTRNAYDFIIPKIKAIGTFLKGSSCEVWDYPTDILYEAVLNEDYTVEKNLDLSYDFAGDYSYDTIFIPLSYWTLTPVN